jgi:colicin import membrane protein
MQAARLIAAPIAVLATFGAFALVQAADGEGERTRLRAEELAEAASQRFTEVLQEKRLAQAQSTKPAARPPAKEGDGEYPWTAGLRWFENSSREFQGLMRRLSQAGGAVDAAKQRQLSTPAAKPTPPPVTAPAEPSSPVASKPETKEPDGVDWLTRSSQRFRALMRRLAEGAAPPTAAPPAAKDEPREVVDAPAPKPAISSAPSSEQPSAAPPKVDAKPEEERRLAEARQAEAAKREAEVKKTEEVLKAEQAKKAAEAKEAKRVAEAKQGAEALKAEQAKKAAEAKEAKRVAEAKQAEEALKAEQAKKLMEAKTVKKAEEDEQRRLKAQTEADAKRAAELSAKAAEERRPAQREAQGSATKAGETKQAQPKDPAEPQKKAQQARKEDAKKTAEPKKAAGPTPAEPRAARRAKASAEKAARSGSRRQVASGSCESAGTQVDPPGWYLVKEGDTLWSIAERHYGAGARYKRIYAANRRRLRGTHWIYPCQRVYLPRAAHRA